MIKGMIFLAPAGSGKTERLADRYIELLKSGVSPDKILTITFTENAAAEMKERIFKKLKKADPKLLSKLKEEIFKLRISTIDSFCLSLLRLFSPLLRIDPDAKVLEETRNLWEEIIYDTIMRIAEKEQRSPDYERLLELIVENRFKGLSRLFEILNRLFDKRLSAERASVPKPDLIRLEELKKVLISDPKGKERIPNYARLFPDDLNEITIFSIAEELEKMRTKFLTQNNKPRKTKEDKELQEWFNNMYDYWTIIQKFFNNQFLNTLFNLFKSQFLAEYKIRKGLTSQVDFADLELLAYHLITTSPEWSNILWTFDKHTDHILVDEFQDTSFLQWAIIDKLTEEWRAGYGAKPARKITPSIFLVGDDKQSIYLFRNANCEVFDVAQKRLAQWLNKEDLEIKRIEDNYRSLEAIIGFTNYLFSRLMNPRPDAPAWKTRYAPFKRSRINSLLGTVEIILAAPLEKAREKRKREAEMIAKRIKSLIGEKIVFDLEEEQPIACRYEHITILLRKRTNLAVYEEVFRQFSIPHIVVKGIGFYLEPEIGLMRAIVSTLLDPADDFNLYLFLRSPLLGISEREIFIINQRKGTNLWQRLLDYNKKTGKVGAIIEKIENWRNRVNNEPLVSILEEILAETKAWKIFWEAQRRANIKKFIRIVENLEWEGKHPLRIKDYFDRASENEDEPKATVNTTGRNEVKIMTVHAAKGLQFPVVFFPELDENLKPKPDSLLIDEQDEKNVFVSYLPDSSLRKQDELYILRQAKELEEEKRIFYVAVTRARDALFLTGIWDIKENSRLSWLIESLGIEWQNEDLIMKANIPGVKIISEKMVDEIFASKETLAEIEAEFKPKPVNNEPVREISKLQFKVVSKEMPRHLRRHDEDSILFGAVIHQLFDEISKGKLGLDDDAIAKEAERLFFIKSCPKEKIRVHIRELLEQLSIIRKEGILPIIQPVENSYSELPFFYKDSSGNLYSGRIDRVIVKDNRVEVYDYKTYGLSEDELPGVIESYRQQPMAIYKAAVKELFKAKEVKGYLVFTALGKIFEM